MSRPSRIRIKRESMITLDAPGHVTISELEDFIVSARELGVTDVAELSVSINPGYPGNQRDHQDPTCTITASAPPQSRVMRVPGGLGT